jgi:hypothetical protein
LVPEQRVQRRAAFQCVRRTQQQSGRKGVGMCSALHKVTRTGCSGFVGYALKRCLRKVELKHTQRLIDVPS